MTRNWLVLLAFLFLHACSSSESGRKGGATKADFNCDGACEHQSLSMADVETIVRRVVTGARVFDVAATVAVVDRVGNVLAVYQMTGASATTTVNGQINAVGGLENTSVPSTLAAISKAGTGAYLSSQGNAFSTRTASQIIQEHFNPGEKFQTAGPLFGVQFSQLPCSDLTVRNPEVDDDARASVTKPSIGGLIGPRFLPLGLSADPGGLPLYRKGDVVGGVGVELDGQYRLDRDLRNADNDIEERLALIGTVDLEAPSKRVAPNVNRTKSLNYSDIGYEDLDMSALEPLDTLDPAQFLAVTEFSTSTPRAGSTYGDAASGILSTTRAGINVETLTLADGTLRYPTQAGTTLGGAELSIVEVDALLDSAITVASKARAAIRRPLDTAARVNIWVVDHRGVPLGYVRSQDAPVFGIDVSLQKARSAAFFSSSTAGADLSTAGFGTFVSAAEDLLGSNIFSGNHAFSNRAIGNLSRPYFPDGVDGRDPGPLSFPFPGSTNAAMDTWSPFNTGLQFDLIFTNLAKALGLIASVPFPDSCVEGAISTQLANGIQIFPGSVPLYRGNTLVGAIGVSGDGIDQDDLIAFYGASRRGLNAAGHSSVGDPVLGFNAARELRSDKIQIPSVKNTRLRYVNCPESPWIGSEDQNVCNDL